MQQQSAASTPRHPGCSSPICEFTAASSLGSCQLHTGQRTLPVLSGEGGRQGLWATGGGWAGAAAAAAAAAAPAPGAAGACSADSWDPPASSGLPIAVWGAVEGVEPLGAALPRFVGSLPSSEWSDPRPRSPDMAAAAPPQRSGADHGASQRADWLGDMQLPASVGME